MDIKIATTELKISEPLAGSKYANKIFVNKKIHNKIFNVSP